jgi:hypothetical protein
VLDLLREVQRTRAARFLPIDTFLWHASQAFISAAQGCADVAREHASQPLTAAAVTNTGLRYHPTFGLVPSKYVHIESQLVQLLSK